MHNDQNPIDGAAPKKSSVVQNDPNELEPQDKSQSATSAPSLSRRDLTLAIGKTAIVLSLPSSAADAAGYYNSLMMRKQGPCTGTSGTLWTMGNNGNGALGLGDTVQRNSPVQIGGLSTWNQVAVGGYQTLAIRTDGTLWVCGNGGSGMLGLGNSASRSAFVQLGNLSNWKYVGGGQFFSTALRSDGTLWSWGQNSYQNLGLGDNTNRSSPVQVGNLSTWNQLNTGPYASLVIKSDGTLWNFGADCSGPPTQIGNLSNWTQISSGRYHSCMLRGDGTWWSFGTNSSGQLGLGDTVNRACGVPVQVGNLSVWKSVGAGYWTTAATRNDNTLWVTGLNSSGQLGTNNSTSYSAPVQVGNLSKWVQVAPTSRDATMALANDGTLWTWGLNGNGQLGLGDVANRSSPTQVGTSTAWTRMIATGLHSMVIRG